MNIGELIFYPLLVGSMLLLVATGYVEIRNGLRNGQKNLVVLGIAYILTVSYLILLAFTTRWVLINLNLTIIYFLIFYFVIQTFYIKSKVLFRFMLAVMIISACIMNFLAFAIHGVGIYEISTLIRFIDILSMNLLSFTAFLSCAILAYKNYEIFRKENIEPWIYVRLKIIAVSSGIIAFLNVPEFVRLNPDVSAADPNDPISLFVFFIQSTMMILFACGQFVAWIMPVKLKEYCREKYEYLPHRQHEGELTEEEVLKQLRGGTDE